MYSQYRKISKLVILAFLSINLPAMASKLYTDIPPGHWAENAADVLGEEKIMSGASTNEFGGNLTVNRYEVARIINGLMGNRSIPTSIILLSDVRSGHPDFRTIMKILSANLMDTAGNKFNGDKKVTRYELANYIIKTLDYLQADSISIRQPPKAIGNIAAEKRDLINKAVNYWQLTEGYNDWDQTINRYGALEMVSKAAININPDLFIRIGNVNKTGDTPVQPTSPPQQPTVQPTVMPTAAPTSVALPTGNPFATPVPDPVPTAVVPTPYISNPTVAPTAMPTTEPMVTPVPLRTPVISTPTPESTIIPTSIPTPVVTEAPQNNPVSLGNPILRSQITLKGIYNFMYSETIPSLPIAVEPVRSHDDTLGLSVGGDVSYWLKDIDIPVVRDMGILASVNALGGYAYPKANPDTLINESFRVNLSALYKIIRTPEIEFAAGIEGFMRNNSRESQKTVVDSYWRASKSYIGIGLKGLLGWRPLDKFVIEASFAGHYAPQTINETLTYSGVTPTPGSGNTIDRINIDFGLDGRYDIIQFGSSWLYADLNVNGRFLIGDGSQTIVGAGGGLGVSF